MDVDADIQDILAGLDTDAGSPEVARQDYELLTRLWVAERAVPELLPWPGGVVERVMGRIKGQIIKIEDLISSGAEGAVPTASAADPATNPTLNLKLSILQSDLARAQFLVRSLLRQRLAKLCRFSIYYLRLSSYPPGSDPQSSQTQSSSLLSSQFTADPVSSGDPGPGPHVPGPPYTGPYRPGLLSRDEHSFLVNHQALLTAHYLASFLGAFPPPLRRLDDNAGGLNMVDAPETREVVVVRCLAGEACVVVPLGDSGGGGDGSGADGSGGKGEFWFKGQGQGQGQGQGDRRRPGSSSVPPMGSELGSGPGEGMVVEGVRMRRGEMWLVRWEGIREAWRKGEVEVL